jgi:hypothetical protein
MISSLLSKTGLKASALCLNGDNLLHLVIRRKGTTTLVSLIQNTISEELAEHPTLTFSDYLNSASSLDGLTVLENATNSKYAALFFADDCKEGSYILDCEYVVKT